MIERGRKTIEAIGNGFIGLSGITYGGSVIGGLFSGEIVERFLAACVFMIVSFASGIVLIYISEKE